MKKNFKNILSLTVALAIVMTVCPLWAFATDTLTAESFLGEQVSTAVTENFVVPTDYEWTASNDALTIDNETGEVTVNKLPTEDRPVTLTANGEKNFELVVKSQTTKVENYFNFADESQLWAPVSGTAKNAAIETEADGNNYLSLDYAGDAWSIYPMGFALNEMTGNFTVSFDFKLDWLSEAPAENATAVNKGYERIALDFNISPNETGAAADKKDAIVARALVIEKDNLVQIGYTSITNGEAFDRADWSNVTVEINPVKTQARVLLPDGKWSAWYDMLSKDNKPNYVGGKLNHILTARTYSKGYVGTLMLDNFSVTTQSFDNLTAEEKMAYFKENITPSSISNESLAAITSKLNLNTFDGAVVWESSDENVVAADGIVTRPASKVFKTVTLTAKLAETDEIIRVINIAVAPEGTTTNVALSGTTILTDDFEKGTPGEAVAEIQASSGIGAKNEWEYIDALGEDKSFVYAEDENRGTVAKFSYTGEDRARVAYFAGSWIKSVNERYSVGFDFKYIPDEAKANKFRFEFNGAGAMVCLVFDYEVDKLYYYVQATSSAHTYAISDFVGEDGWIRVDAVHNNVSRTQDVYINGKPLYYLPTAGTLYNTVTDASPLRSVSFQLYGSGAVLLDNVGTVKYTDNDYTKVNAAIEAVKMTYVYYAKRNIFTTETELPSYGPADRNTPGERVDANKMITSAVFPEDANGAKLTWEGKGVTEKDGKYYFAPVTPGANKVTVTATYNDATVTETIYLTGEMVTLTYTDGIVSATGATDGGKLLVVKYEGKKISEIKIVNATSYTVADAGSYKAFWLDGTLAPYARTITFEK